MLKSILPFDHTPNLELASHHTSGKSQNNIATGPNESWHGIKRRFTLQANHHKLHYFMNCNRNNMRRPEKNGGFRKKPNFPISLENRHLRQYLRRNSLIERNIWVCVSLFRAIWGIFDQGPCREIRWKPFISPESPIADQNTD